MRTRDAKVAENDCYTLLADDSSVFANSAEAYKAFKAHVVLNVILNGGIVFSDNQTICSRNLRMLARDDGMIRELFRQGQFGVALRQGFKTDAPDEMVSMAELHHAFVLEGKIRHAETDFEKSGELLFIEQHARRIPWSYDAVRTTYTDTCQSVLFNEFERLLSDRHYEIFRKLILDERERDKGLGREFLQKRLGREMVAAGMIVDEEVLRKLQSCTDAPYVSNLPKTIGLNPIYATEHRSSFELVRGRMLRFEDIAAPRDVRMRLRYDHFVEGLNWLDLEDILFLQECAERKEYLKRVRAVRENARHLDDVEVAYEELNLRIEDRVIQRRRDLKVHTPGGEIRRLRKQVAVGADYAMEVVDCVALDFETLGMPETLLVKAGIKIVFDVVKGKIEGDAGKRPFLEPAVIAVQKKKLAAYLEDRGLDQRISIDESIRATSSFDKEIVIS